LRRLNQEQREAEASTGPASGGPAGEPPSGPRGPSVGE
jgi:hypothetical protein